MKFALVLLAALLFAHVDAQSAEKPNVLLIIADQWRAQAFGFAGDPNVKTPNLDRLERECVNFTQAVSGTPVCTPTRASLLTGQRPQTHGLFINDTPLNPSAVTIAKELKEHGYDTGCIGKWHVDGHGREGFIPAQRRQGFDYWKVLECTHDYNHSPYYADGPEKLTWSGYDAIAQTSDAQKYIGEHAKSGSKPFLLWLAWGPPHNPYESAPAKYKAMYSADKIQLRGNVPPEMAAAARGWLAGYYAHCTALDDCVGELLRTLKETGLDKNTIIVFTADHGDMLGSQSQQRKQRPWDEAARVPMLFRLPASLEIKPRRVEGTINTEDVMPTLLSLCGRVIPPSVEGFDFSGHLRGGADPSKGGTIIRCVAPFGEFTSKNGGKEYREVRTPHYSYARDLNGPWLLYDNEKDPLQLANLIGKPEHAQAQAELDALLKKKLAEQHDEFLPGAEYIKKWGYKVGPNGTMPEKP
jgi:arylsulfatase A-like enzyme